MSRQPTPPIYLTFNYTYIYIYILKKERINKQWEKKKTKMCLLLLLLFFCEIYTAYICGYFLEKYILLQHMM